MRGAFLLTLLLCGGLTAPALADRESLVQVVCEPGAGYFSVETVIVDRDGSPPMELSAGTGNGLRSLTSVKESPVACRIRDRQVEARVLRVYEPGVSGQGSGLYAGLIAVAVDGKQVAELNATHRSQPEPRGRVRVEDAGVTICRGTNATVVGGTYDRHQFVVEDCTFRLFQELGLAKP